MTQQETHGSAASPLERNREKVLQLLEFLKRYVELKMSSPVRDVEQYANDGLVLWFHGLPSGKGIYAAPLPPDLSVTLPRLFPKQPRRSPSRPACRQGLPAPSSRIQGLHHAGHASPAGCRRRPDGR